MTAGNDFDPELDQPRLFSALLTPHRSLNRTGFVVLMSFHQRGQFRRRHRVLLMGAWPVLGFFGLDVLVIYWAFRINFRQAAASEEITVTPSELRIRRISHRGHVMEWVLNPLWVQLDQTAMRNSASSGSIWSPEAAASPIASFLGPDEKASFAKALAGRVARRAARPNVQPDQLGARPDRAL